MPLAAGTSQWVDPTVATASTTLAVYDMGGGVYTLASRGRRVTGSLVADGHGGYIVAPHDLTGAGRALLVGGITVIY